LRLGKRKLLTSHAVHKGIQHERKKMVEVDDYKLAEHLRAAVGAFVRKTREGASTPSSAQSETLSLLERKGPLSAAALARLRGVTHQSMRVTAGELVEQGLVADTPDPEDGRSKLYQLNAEGQRTLHALRQARARWLTENWVSTLTQAERQTIQDAIELLNRIV
jgi:DNA-binding MarR family transcriptional regulator